LSSNSVSAADPKDCECYSDLDKLGAAQIYKNPSKILKAVCVAAPGGNTCNIKDQAKVIGKDKLAPTCFYITSAKAGVTDEQRCKEFVAEWQIQYDQKVAEGKKVANSSSNEVSAGSSVLSDLINKCGKYPMPTECWDITVFVEVLLQMVNYLFGIIGALALGAFVYGGFVLILSQGNPDKVKQGTGAMINAVIGIAIAFSGYVLVSYLGEVLHLKEAFKLLQ
jgi:hypothetical protein